MARVLVTGGAGYVGSVCCRQLLESGHQVVVLDDLSTGHAAAVPPGAAFHHLDYGDRAGVARLLEQYAPEAVFHFAAKALIAESVSNPGPFFDQNVASGIAFLETLRPFQVRRFIFSSSAAVYGNPEGSPIDENFSKNPVNAYGESKLLLEQILRWYAAAYGWTVVAFRYFNASGATEDAGEDHRPETHILPLLLETASGQRKSFEIYGCDYPTPDGTCVRDYVHVADIAAAHMLALDVPEDRSFRAYNIGLGRGYSVREVIDAAEQVTGRKIHAKPAPRRPGDPAVLCASPGRLRRELGWKPLHPDLREIIQSAWEWQQKHPFGYEVSGEVGSAA